jgi:hypothetical protein
VKENGVAYALWAIGPIFGIHGMHRFYMGHVGMGLLHLFTFGLCGIGWIIDAALIPGLVAESNAIAMGHYRPQGMQFRPAQQYRQQSTSSGIAVGIILLGAVAGSHQAEVAQVEMEMARQEAEMARAEAEAEGRPVRSSSSSAHPEVVQLHDAAERLHGVIDNKLKPLIHRFEKDLNRARQDLRRLKPKINTDKAAKFKATKLIQECKEIKVFLKRLNTERSRYVEQVEKLEFSIRSLERKLEVAEFLGQDDKAELKKLVALSDTLVEEADKGFRHKEGSLESEVESEGEKTQDDAEVDRELENELDAALEEDQD